MTSGGDPLFDRVLPHNLDAERSVLGAILIHNAALDDVAEVVFEPDFYRHAHRRIYAHIVQLAHANEPIDFVTLKDALMRSGELDEVGGPAYLSSLVDGLPHSSNVGYYAKIVREKATLREVIAAASKAVARAYEDSDPAADILDSVQQELFSIAAAQRRGLVPMPEVVGELFQLLDKLSTQRGPVTGVSLGLTDLDYLTAGLQKSDLVILAARPSMGKTALAVGGAFYAATVQKKHVAVFSLEMSRTQLGLRQLSAEARIDGHRLRTGMIRESEWEKITNALAKMNDATLHIDDSCAMSVTQMRAQARKQKVSTGLDLVVVDYVQLMDSRGEDGENRTQQLATISRGLKLLAKDLDVPVLLLSQLNRELEKRADKRPMLSDLRESGALEQDADVVMFLYRESVYDESADPARAEIIVAKQRSGPTGTAFCAFDSHTARFFNDTRVPV